MIYCLQKPLVSMDAISGVLGSGDWSQDSELMQSLDATYRKHLRPHVHTDGNRSVITKIAWELYCLELGCIFSEQFPDKESATSFFRKLSEEYGGYLSPIITSSYIEDLSALWTDVHPALLEVNIQTAPLDWSVADTSLCRLLAGSSRSLTTDRITIVQDHCTTPRSHSGVMRANSTPGRGVSKNHCGTPSCGKRE